MKPKSIEELKDGMWCRLASGEVYTYRSARYSSYDLALLDMGAEWYPKIPDGYRLATEEDRKGPKPKGALALSTGCANGAFGWGECAINGGVFSVNDEYIVPEKPEPKVYTVQQCNGYGECVIRTGKDFQPGKRVRVEKVEG